MRAWHFWSQATGNGWGSQDKMIKSFGNDEDVSGFEGDVLVDGYETRHQGVC